jgi:hypothetical protein
MACWRIVETATELPEVSANVAKLATDKIDYLRLVSCDRYGFDVLTIPQARSISEMSGDCASEPDFHRRVAALADPLGHLAPCDALPDAERGFAPSLGECSGGESLDAGDIDSVLAGEVADQPQGAFGRRSRGGRSRLGKLVIPARDVRPARCGIRACHAGREWRFRACGCPILWNPILRSAHASCAGTRESQYPLRLALSWARLVDLSGCTTGRGRSLIRPYFASGPTSRRS